MDCCSKRTVVMRKRNWYRYAVAAKNDSGITVGELDILMEGGTITATVTGRRRYCDLAQGGHREFTDRASNKITRHINNTDFNDANWIKRVIKILASITRPTVYHHDNVIEMAGGNDYFNFL